MVWRITVLLTTVLFGLASTASSSVAFAAQSAPDLQRIQTLYESAAYDEAVRALDAAEDTSMLPVEQRQTLLQYRALCLLALDRELDAEKAVAQILTINPLRQLTENDAPPRLVKMFEQVRARVVPGLAREQYASAKALFDGGRFAEAAPGFERVGQLVSSVDSTGERHDLADIATLAEGFLQLSRARRVVPEPAADTAATKVFTDSDVGVVPPVPVRQEIPPWRPVNVTAGVYRAGKVREGRLDIVIGPTGDVKDGVMTTPIDPMYDVMLLRAARGWKYQPARRGGVAVTYRHTVFVRLTLPPGGVTGFARR